MADIDINAGLAVKADVNKLYGDVVGTVAKFREDRRYNKEAYNELLEKYAGLATDIEGIRNQLNELVETAQANKLPNADDVQAFGAIAGLLGAKNSDGSINLSKIMELKDAFGEAEK